MLDKRRSGVLLHISSLPSPYGIGDLGPSAYKFVDWLKKSGQTLWQILPLNETFKKGSPYSAISAFGGNPNFISPDLLFKEKLLTNKNLKKPPTSNFKTISNLKYSMVKIAFSNFSKKESLLFEKFCMKEKAWLDDYALFLSLSFKYGFNWLKWPSALKNREEESLNRFERNNEATIKLIKCAQYLFHKQWKSLKNYANKKGIKIIGDLPIFISMHSMDVWKSPEKFELGNDYSPSFISGVPPDAFSKTGQCWQNPLYNWSTMKKSKFRWWVSRLRYNLSLYDIVRVDHFRGFVAYWKVPAKSEDATKGFWAQAPGDQLLQTIKKEIKNPAIIAEDLGKITPAVHKLRIKHKIPGMRILHFAFGTNKQNPYLPQNFETNTIAYPGTHDNDTTIGWAKSLSTRERASLKRHLDIHSFENINWDLAEALCKSKAKWVIFPMQDILSLDSRARMNLPSTEVGNWKWRFDWSQLAGNESQKLLQWSKQYKRNLF